MNGQESGSLEENGYLKMKQKAGRSVLDEVHTAALEILHSVEGLEKRIEEMKESSADEACAYLYSVCRCCGMNEELAADLTEYCAQYEFSIIDQADEEIEVDLAEIDNERTNNSVDLIKDIAIEKELSFGEEVLLDPIRSGWHQSLTKKKQTPSWDVDFAHGRTIRAAKNLLSPWVLPSGKGMRAKIVCYTINHSVLKHIYLDLGIVVALYIASMFMFDARLDGVLTYSLLLLSYTFSIVRIVQLCRWTRAFVQHEIKTLIVCFVYCLGLCIGVTVNNLPFTIITALVMVGYTIRFVVKS